MQIEMQDSGDGPPLIVVRQPQRWKILAITGCILLGGVEIARAAGGVAGLELVTVPALLIACVGWVIAASTDREDRRLQRRFTGADQPGGRPYVVFDDLTLSLGLPRLHHQQFAWVAFKSTWTSGSAVLT